MGKKIALFAFNGDPVCFVHVLLNALDMSAKGFEITVVMEGSAVKLIRDFSEGTSPLTDLYEEVKGKGLIGAVCRACSSKMGVLEFVEREGLPISDEMSGHPAMSSYLDAGYELIIF
jgi:hypothetical protein